MFAYSARPQTAASKIPGQLPADVKHQRLQNLIAVVRKMVL
jgi:tRNA A37 methylthiotransferase MiaB